jgi:hypothetical protein
MKLHQLSDQSESDACTFMRSSASALDSMKAVEDKRQFLFRYTNAGIADPK